MMAGRRHAAFFLALLGTAAFQPPKTLLPVRCAENEPRVVTSTPSGSRTDVASTAPNDSMSAQAARARRVGGGQADRREGEDERLGDVHLSLIHI